MAIAHPRPEYAPDVVRVRLGRPSDFPAVALLQATIWQDAELANVPCARPVPHVDRSEARDEAQLAAASLQRRVRRRELHGALTSRRGHLVVAERGHSIVGMARSGPARDASAPQALELYHIVVDAHYRGRGVSEGLLAAATGSQGCYLWVDHDNHRAVSFYERCGYRVTDSRSAAGVRQWCMVRP